MAIFMDVICVSSLSAQRDLRVLQKKHVFNENPLKKLRTLEKYLELFFYSLDRT